MHWKNYSKKRIYGGMSIRRKGLTANGPTAKCSYGELSVRRIVRTAKCTYGEMYVRRNVRTAKCTYGKLYVRQKGIRRKGVRQKGLRRTVLQPMQNTLEQCSHRCM